MTGEGPVPTPDNQPERCECRPCPGRGFGGHGMQHCAECCFGTHVEADPGCPEHGYLPAPSTPPADDLVQMLRDRMARWGNRFMADPDEVLRLLDRLATAEREARAARALAEAWRADGLECGDDLTGVLDASADVLTAWHDERDAAARAERAGGAS